MTSSKRMIREYPQTSPVPHPSRSFTARWVG
jgi:hypothetical protein